MKKIFHFVTACVIFCNIFMLPVQAQNQALNQNQKPAFPLPVVPDGLGYNIHFTDAKPGEMEMLADSGATIIRMDLSWGG
ncbi:MAG: hypothetical protein LBG58_11755, partial [Planctomycetaceae bacterium]|nr:hypothetical protein [Planctomycetaceae bacterium]